MDSQRIYIWICFFFCLALSAGGVLIFFQKKEIKTIPASRFLQYFLILIYTFGFYSMWSKVFLKILFDAIDKSETLSSLPGYLALIGTPFLIIGMFMLILWGINLLQKKPHNLFLPVFFMLVFLLLLVYITYKRFNLLVNVHQVYALFVLLTTAFTGMLLLFSEVKHLEKKSKNILILLVSLSGIIHIPLFLDQLESLLSELVFVFMFFLVNTGIGMYYAYTVKTLSSVEYDGPEISFGLFIKQYNITARESEIVQEIYKGKTNQEIANKLFVTVQTIKDHTSRIYLKTNVKNRAQLTSFLRRYE